MHDDASESVAPAHEDASQETSTTPSSSADAPPPTFAFATWKAELELMLQRESETVHECVQALQSEFDDRSQLVRGDFAWRKQVTAFHDRLQDVLSHQLSVLSTNVSDHAAVVAQSLAQTLAKTERDTQRAVQEQEQKGESTLRRARTALAKEVERITRLEKCLRQEEARQAAAILAERERQLTAEHKERESHLQAMLGDARASNESLETLNTQLLEALRTSRSELEQLRNTLVKSVSRPKSRRGSSLAQSPESKYAASHGGGGSGDRSGKNCTVDALPSTANELLLVPALKQSLSAATQTVAALKTRVSELESARDSDKHRVRELQLSIAHAENEKAKATKLLGEARSALIDNQRKVGEAAVESKHWQEKFETLHALVQGREQAFADSQRFQNATRDQLEALTGRLQRVMTIEAQWREFEHAVAKWKETQQQQKEGTQISESSDDCNRILEQIVESFAHLETSGGSEPIELLRAMETQNELEVRLRYQFEKQYGEQLILRVSYERRRVLERLERLCALEATEKQDRPQRIRQRVSRINNLESDFTRLKRLLKSAYKELGICVGAWSETDLDGLHARLEAMKAQVQSLEFKLEAAVNRAESQRVTLVRAELAQHEKDLLLAELTARYRQLRASQAAWHAQQLEQQRQPIQRKPLAVYGIPQPMAQKPKLHSLMQLPVRARPASASPSLGSVEHYAPRRLSQPPPSRLGPHLDASRKSLDQQKIPNESRMEEVEEHVRSVLKSALMQQERENQLEEDTVGSDGVLEILHRRRHRK